MLTTVAPAATEWIQLILLGITEVLLRLKLYNSLLNLGWVRGGDTGTDPRRIGELHYATDP